MDGDRRVWVVAAVVLALAAGFGLPGTAQARGRASTLTVALKLRAPSAVRVPVRATCAPVRVTLRGSRGRATVRRLAKNGRATLRVRATLPAGRQKLRLRVTALRRAGCRKLLRVGRPSVRPVAGTAGQTGSGSGQTGTGTSPSTGAPGTAGPAVEGAGSGTTPTPGPTTAPAPAPTTAPSDPPPTDDDVCVGAAAPGGAPLSFPPASHTVPLGAAANTLFLGEPGYAEALERFDTLTAENETKMETLRPTEDTWDWGPAEQLVAAGASLGKPVRGHALVWHEQLPEWFTTRKWTATDLRTYLKNYVTTTVCHFRGRIKTWDLVNEPLALFATPAAPYRTNTTFYKVLGPGYIADVFRWAHAADPSAAFFINDFNTEFGEASTEPGMANRTKAQLKVVKGLLADGVPISGVGFQVHNDSKYHRVTQAEATSSLQAYTDLGLQVAVTEMDVAQSFESGPDADAHAADVFGGVARACRSLPRCTSFSVWGVDDGHSWQRDNGDWRPLLLDSTYAPKPAWDAVDAALR